MEQYNAALRDLEKLGAKKDFTVTHDKHTEVQSIVHTIARTVMRNVSPEIEKQLHTLHTMICKEFAHMSDESIQWLLDAVPAARGTFKNPMSFRSFFQHEPSTISSSRLITAIDSITAALAYRAINSPKAPPPIIPVNTPAQEMYDKIHQMFDGSMTPFLGEKTYSMRNIEFLNPSQITSGYVEAYADDVSDVSDMEDDGEKKPKKKLPSNYFKVRLNPLREGYTWAAAAQKGHIPIRGHVSGTTPLALSIINCLYNREQNPWLQDKENTRTLAGALLLPSYVRGDFHSIAETTAGVEYYLQVRATEAPIPYSPQQCFQFGLQYMANATHDEANSTLEALIPYVISKTESLSVMINPNLEEAFAIIHQTNEQHVLKRLIDYILPKIIQSQESNDQKLSHLHTLREILGQKEPKLISHELGTHIQKSLEQCKQAIKEIKERPEHRVHTQTDTIKNKLKGFKDDDLNSDAITDGFRE